MEMTERIAKLEAKLDHVLDHVRQSLVTKADLREALNEAKVDMHQALHAQTWKSSAPRSPARG